MRRSRGHLKDRTFYLRIYFKRRISGHSICFCQLILKASFSFQASILTTKGLLGSRFALKGRKNLFAVLRLEAGKAVADGCDAEVSLNNLRGIPRSKAGKLRPFSVIDYVCSLSIDCCRLRSDTSSEFHRRLYASAVLPAKEMSITT